MAYRVEITPHAARSLRRLPEKVKARVVGAIDGLEQDPRPVGVKKLRDFDGVYRLRIGDYRLVYAVAEQVLLVVVLTTGHRKDVYQGLPSAVISAKRLLSGFLTQDQES
ncbi:MAG: type II toxin-antitoxin system RelE/ParE family toxin [Thermodesulfobacteriota bacterium]